MGRATVKHCVGDGAVWPFFPKWMFTAQGWLW